ncbi:MmeI protein [Novimethylophilus kurashikiensis]|uniref:MmeI protein n=1 Tax=Novimethylophilus kurashikiensis TaxID=1825523 RepID=A0A2R5F723_9PROT|nr:hypothetical protein [Novimethylophilus kurashikiensis]GBG14030.1 MmeI protein [Novimethylophilus kurashikiensis]
MAEESIALETHVNVAGFCEQQSKDIEHEIERMGIVLGINWDDESQVQSLAKEALEHAQKAISDYEHAHRDYQKQAKATLFALAAMMMDMMAASADKGIHTHGGNAWKAFSKALMKEKGII